MSLLAVDQPILGGTYVVERLVGSGAFAEVYRVNHRFLGRQAMKVFRGAGATSDDIEKMLGEAIMLSKLGHPNIVQVFDANTFDSPHGARGFFTMEYVAGGNLEQFWLSHDQRFVPIETTVEILTQVCRGLSVAHGEVPPIAHRDIKPQNILVGYDANGLRVRVSDFGLATKVDPETLMATAKGSVAFKAPETFANRRSDSCAGDVWAIGTTAYLLLTDHLPYEGLIELDLVKGKAFRKPVLKPSRLNIDVDPDLEAIVLKALALNPADRYPTAAEMLDDLVAWSTTARSTGKTLAPARTSKERIGAPTSRPSGDDVKAMVAEALRLGSQAATLGDAADLMEEAFNKDPALRDEYAGQVRLWRNGIVR